jgi:phage/plasmid-associated DNA primase
MYIIEVETHTRHEFFHAWANEVYNRVCNITGVSDPVYAVFLVSGIAYVYTTSHPEHGSPTAMLPWNARLLRDMDGADATPVHCNPDVDMSTTSFEEFDGIRMAPYAEYAMEDVTIGDIVRHIEERAVVSSSTVAELLDDDIRHMQLFVGLALPGSDTSKLMSFINHSMAVKGYDSIMYPGVPPSRHTVLEVRSEMMRCNPQMYSVYKHKLLNAMLESLQGSRSKSEMEHRLSGVVYEILFDNVVSCMGTMWCFSDGIWQECPYDGYVWKFLTNDFIEYLESKGANDIALHMMSTHARTRVMKDVKLRLQDDNFHKLLDSKRATLRMVNGVYDTDTEILLDPVPSDYVSVVSGVPYQVFDPASSRVRRLMSILGSIFPEPEVLDFFLLSCSTFLEGYNTPKVFYIWWGAGNNAKSLVQTLVMRTFGEYCSTAPTSLVTGQRSNASNATPELCHVEKRLVVFLQEPNPEERIKAGKMKEMTGNDSMYVRQLFKSGKTITFKAKIVIVCNNTIEIPGMDAAIRRRIIVIPFTSTFLSPEEHKARSIKRTLEPNSHIIDPSVERGLMECKSAFMHVLCRRYSEFRDAGFSLEIPERIRRVTDDYVTKNNHQLIFIRHFVHRVPGSTAAAAEVYEMFKEWFTKSYPGKRVQDFDRFTKELCEEGYKEDGKGVVSDAFVSYTGL